MEGADLLGAHLEGADLFNAFFDSVTTLNGAYFSNKQWGAATLVDVHWADVNLAVVDWSTVSVLGDEIMARSIKTTVGVFRRHGGPGLYERPARAYRQLAVVLRNQGLSDEANRFAYRAQLMQHKVYWYQKKLPQWLFSWFLSLLAGYGYKPLRSFLAYLIVIATFAAAYFIVGQRVGPALSPLSAWVFSMTSFHGRGFFPGGIKLDDPLTVLAAFEAFIGLLIEVTFIATFTRRLFGQ